MSDRLEIAGIWALGVVVLCLFGFCDVRHPVSCVIVVLLGYPIGFMIVVSAFLTWAMMLGAFSMAREGWADRNPALILVALILAVIAIGFAIGPSSDVLFLP